MPPKPEKRAETISEIVENGLCVGCGLVQAISGPDAIRFVMTPEGRERPLQTQEIAADDWQVIARTCPGMRVTGASEGVHQGAADTDPVRGPYQGLHLGYATDHDIRFRAAQDIGEPFALVGRPCDVTALPAKAKS